MRRDDGRLRLAGAVLIAASLLGGWLLPRRAEAQPTKKPRLFFQLRAVHEPQGTKPSMAETARGSMLETLKKQPEVLLDLGPGAPEKGPELGKQLAQRGLAGYQLGLRINKLSHSMEPPPAGKAYKVLMVEVDVVIDAQRIPDGQMSLAGQGSAQVGTETNRYTEKERLQLAREALDEAIQQAVVKSVEKLTAGDKKGGGKRPARRPAKKTR